MIFRWGLEVYRQVCTGCMCVCVLHRGSIEMENTMEPLNVDTLKVRTPCSEDTMVYFILKFWH